MTEIFDFQNGNSRWPWSQSLWWFCSIYLSAYRAQYSLSSYSLSKLWSSPSSSRGWESTCFSASHKTIRSVAYLQCYELCTVDVKLYVRVLITSAVFTSHTDIIIKFIK